MRTRSVHMIVVAAALLLAVVVILTTRRTDNQERSATEVGILDPTSRASGRATRARFGATGTRQMQNGKGSSGAKDGSAAAAGDVATSCTVTGTVLNEEGQPVEGARITVRTNLESFKQVVKTSKTGTFSVPGVPAGTYDILAMHDHFVPLIRPNYSITPADRQVRVDFRLPLGATVNGDVVDEEGKPIPGVRVAAHRRKAEQVINGASIFHDNSTYRTNVTDKPGTFTLTGVSLGPNVFEFTRPGFAPETKKIEITSEKAKERLKITLKKTGEIAGLVLNGEGKPVSTATVHLTRYKPFQGPEEKLEKGKITATSDPEGRFQFKKLYNEGFYDILVEEASFAPGVFPLVAVGTSNLACPLDIGGIIEGTAQYIDRPTTPAAVLIAAESVIKGTTFTATAQSDGAGRYAFSKLPYGTYKLKVDHSGTISEPKDGVPCTKEKPTRDVGLEVFEAAVVRGRVADGADDRPVPGATVTIKAAYGPNQGRSKSYMAKTDAHGGFEFRTLPAGLHTALATAPGYIRTLTDRSEQKFTLTPGEKKGDLALHVDHGGSVEGFVVEPNGRPIEGGEVQLFLASQADGKLDPKNLTGKTDVTGFFRISGIEVGERVQLYATVRKRGFAKTQSELLDLTPDAFRVSTNIVMELGGTVAGVVTDAKKIPLQGAEIRFTSSAFPGDPSPSEKTIYTAADGRYELKNCPAGGAAITVSRSGFVRQSRGLTVRDDRVLDRTDFTLQNGYKIAGQVADLYGKAIAGAKVRASGLNGAPGSDEDVTDKDGRFELSNLGQGEFQLEATFKLKTPDGEQNYRFVKPRVPVHALEALIECDVANSLAGRIEDENGRGMKTFLVKLRSKDATKPSQDFTFHLDRNVNQALGYFRVLNVPRGLYSMEVLADGYEPHSEPEIAVGPHKKTDFPTIKLMPAGGVHGTVLSGSTNRPVNGAQVRLLNVAMSDAEANAKAASGSTDYSGQFRVASVPPGTYKVLVNHPSYLGLKVDDIHVVRRKNTGLGDLYLEAGGAVRGTVTDDQGNPVPNLQISVSGLAPGKVTSTDQAGNYLLQGVQHGRWPIVVKGQLNTRTVYAFQTVDIQRDSTGRANFQLNTAADLDGILASATENVIQSGASVRLHPFDENQVVLENVHYDTASREREFSISQVPAGQYFLWAAGYGALGSFTVWQQLFLNRGKNETVVQVPGGAVSGAVVDNAGNGISGLGMQLYPILNNLKLPRSLYNKFIRQEVTTPDGLFAFDNLQPGVYQLLHQSPTGNWYALNPFGLAYGQRVQDYHVVAPR